MPLDFPDAPFPGQLYGQWTWNGIAWVSSQLGAGSYPVGGVLFGLADGNAGSDPDNLLFDPATGSLTVGGTLLLGTPLAIGSGGTAAITAAQALSNLGGLAKAGDTMTGMLTLFGGPSANLDAATKYYVDNAPNQLITLSGAVSGSGTSAITTLLATVPIASGGTGATTAVAALTNLAAAALASPTFTGTPAAPTAATATNTTQLATTAFVKAQGPFLPVTGGALSGSLTVTGTLSSAGSGAGFYFDQRGTANQWLWYAPSATTEARLFNTAVAADRLIINSNGTCTNTTGTWAAISDARLKRDVTEYHGGLAEIIQLRPVEFYYTDKVDTGDQLHFGLIAQEVEPVMPELCGEFSFTGGSEGKGEPETFKTIDPARTVFALINAVKELKTQLDELRAALPPGMQPLPAPQ